MIDVIVKCQLSIIYSVKDDHFFAIPTESLPLKTIVMVDDLERTKNYFNKAGLSVGFSGGFLFFSEG